MDEPSAIRLCLRHGDPAGFEYLADRYRRDAYRHALFLLGNSEDAADICQEAFTRAFVAIRQLARLERFYPWFYQILRNCGLNLLARRQTASRYKRDHLGETAPLATPLPSFLLEQGEEKQSVWRALHQLKPSFREILIMKYLDEASYEVIARNLDIPRGTVMSHLYHARRAFRDAYLEEAQP